MEKHSYVMMIDDDHSILGIISRVLEIEGYPESSDTAREVLSRLEESKPNLVIMDIETPEFERPETLAVLGESAETPVIMLTARCEVTTLRSALSACTGLNPPERPSPDLSASMLSKLKKVTPRNITAN